MFLLRLSHDLYKVKTKDVNEHRHYGIGSGFIGGGGSGIMTWATRRGLSSKFLDLAKPKRSSQGVEGYRFCCLIAWLGFTTLLVFDVS